MTYEKETIRELFTLDRDVWRRIFAGLALHTYLQGEQRISAKDCVAIADALLAELEKK